MKVCPTDAIEPRKYGGVTLRASKCIGCRNCVDACPFGAVFWDDAADKPVICVYCGYCANYCDYGVIKAEPAGGLTND